MSKPKLTKRCRAERRRSVYSEKLLMMDRGTVRNMQFYSKNKFEKLVHLVGRIIRILYDAARSTERQIYHSYRYCYRPTGGTGHSNYVSPVQSYVRSFEVSHSGINRHPAFSDVTLSRLEGAFAFIHI